MPDNAVMSKHFIHTYSKVIAPGATGNIIQRETRRLNPRATKRASRRSINRLILPWSPYVPEHYRYQR
ncbi:hypothetical protein QR510_29370, partial [Escherichia coli]|uniref:hypothetical protein n=1 Tax=Escherichia coli TaxID=562 RepID=UPI002738AAE8